MERGRGGHRGRPQRPSSAAEGHDESGVVVDVAGRKDTSRFCKFTDALSASIRVSDYMGVFLTSFAPILSV